MKILSTIGRITFAVMFVIFGILHLTNGSIMGGMVPSYVPGGVFWVYLTGLGMVAAGVSIIINKYIKLATILLSTMLLIFVLTIHIPHLMNPATAQMAMGGFLKDLAMAGASLFIGQNTAEKTKSK